MVLGLLATVGLCVLELGVYGGAVDVQNAYATYGYFGTGRRVSLSLGNSIAQTYGSGASFSGLDRFGRPIDLDYKLSASTVHRYQYGYDTAGNRLFAEVEQDDGHDNDRSWAYTYDALNRLVTAHIGQLDGSDPRVIVAEPNLPNRRLEWNLDILGNWTGDPNDANDPGFNRYVDADGDDTFDAGAEITHAVNSGNALTSVTTTDLSSNSVTQSYLYDGSGNLIFDGQLFYQYDAFNRLMQVNLAGDLTVNDFDMNAPAGRLKPGVADDAGQKLAAFVYDGFGRLIRTQRWDTLGNSEIESYYYDGVRRIQERIDDDPNDPNSTLATREYVWGPGYVDEIVCQVDERGDLLYYLQDANYNVVAVTNDSGDVIFQYAYEPYGGVVAADTFPAAYPDPNAPPINRIGHQGLFFERLHVDPDDPNDPNDTYDTLADPALSPPTDPNLATPLPGLYQVRNRVLIPNLGRFAQRDMNETALPIITALSMNAQSMEAVISGFALAGHFNDGLNLYTFAGSNPITHRDPSGLDDPFAEVDEIIMALTAGRAAAAHHALGTMGNMAQYAAVMAIQGTLATLFPPFGMYLALEGAAYAIEDMIRHGPTWENTAILGGSFLGGGAFSGIRAKLGVGGLKAVRGALGRVAGGFRWAFGKLAGAYKRMGKSRSGMRTVSATGTGLIDDIFSGGADRILRGKHPDDIPGLIGEAQARGWKVTNLSRGSDKGAGLRMYKDDHLISYTPGTSGRHGGPYWKVSSGPGGILKIPAR